VFGKGDATTLSCSNNLVPLVSYWVEIEILEHEDNDEHEISALDFWVN